MTDEPQDSSPHRPPTEAVFLRPKHKETAISDESIAATVALLPEALIELWHERAAIREFCFSRRRRQN